MKQPRLIPYAAIDGRVFRQNTEARKEKQHKHPAVLNMFTELPREDGKPTQDIYLFCAYTDGQAKAIAARLKAIRYFDSLVRAARWRHIVEAINRREARKNDTRRKEKGKTAGTEQKER